MKRIAVFCGSGSGTEELFYKEAFALGRTLAEKKIGVVYGGAKIGLMGAVADGALSLGGEVIGVLPHFLAGKEIAHGNLTQLLLVDTMHERKTRMHELCDGVITLPGGWGTMEELFEILTWAQLGLHQKPVALLNTNGYYDSLIDCMQTMVSKGFLKEINQRMLLTDMTILGVLAKMASYKAPEVGQWISSTETT
jgi:hypothetical protein